MSDDRSSQPIDIRMPAPPGPPPTFREMLMEISAQIGGLKSSQDYAQGERRQLADKLEILDDRLVEVDKKLEVVISDDRLRDRDMKEIRETLYGDRWNNPGLVKRMDNVEKAQAKAKNIGLGIAVGAGVGGTGLGASLYALGKKLGIF